MSVKTSLDRSLVELEVKFMRLLETDRESAEFERLYHEVDSQLTAFVTVAEAEIIRAS